MESSTVSVCYTVIAYVFYIRQLDYSIKWLNVCLNCWATRLRAWRKSCIAEGGPYSNRRYSHSFYDHLVDIKSYFPLLFYGKDKTTGHGLPALDSAESNPVFPLFCNFLVVSFFRDAPDLDELVSLTPESAKFTCYTERRDTKRDM